MWRISPPPRFNPRTVQPVANCYIAISGALPLGKTRYHCTGGWVGPRAGLDGKSRPGIRSPDRPARSESLHRLRYPGRYCNIVLLINFSRSVFGKSTIDTSSILVCLWLISFSHRIKFHWLSPSKRELKKTFALPSRYCFYGEKNYIIPRITFF